MGSHIAYKPFGFKIQVKDLLADLSFEINVKTLVNTVVNPY